MISKDKFRQLSVNTWLAAISNKNEAYYLRLDGDETFSLFQVYPNAPANPEFGINSQQVCIIMTLLSDISFTNENTAVKFLRNNKIPEYIANFPKKKIYSEKIVKLESWSKDFLKISNRLQKAANALEKDDLAVSWALEKEAKEILFQLLEAKLELK